MKRLISFITLILMLSQVTLMRGNSMVMQNSTDWDLAPSGMLVIEYDLDRNQKADFFSMREVKSSFFSKRPLDQISKFWPDHLVFLVNYGSTSYYYITARYPMFYAMDTDQDGQWDFIYKDILQDGLNTNEQLYDNPSGMALPSSRNFLQPQLQLKQFSWQAFQPNTCTLPPGEALGEFN